MDKPSWKELLDASDEALDAEYNAMFGQQQQPIPDGILPIVQLLIDNPLLVSHVHEYIRRKKAEIATATLIAIHGEDWLRQKQAELQGH